MVDADRNILRLYWKGTLPPAVEAHVEKARRNGATVLVRQAPYTEALLLHEADRISRLPLANGTTTEQRIMQVSPRHDGSGLNVGIYGLPLGATMSEARQLVPALQRTSVPVRMVTMEPLSFTTRMFDVPTYWGGSLIVHHATGYTCSSAFGVTGNNGAATYLVTAAHCGAGVWGSPSYVDHEGQTRRLVYGETIAAGRATGRDVELIRTPGGAGAAVYWGRSINPPNGDAGASTGVAVGGSGSNLIGDAVCLSGALSGTICPPDFSVVVADTNLTLVADPPVNGVGRVTNLVRAEHRFSQVIVGNGDSGGPVVSVRSDGKLSARGVISSMLLGDFERNCVGYAPVGRRCSMVVFFADLRSAMNVVGVRINTS